MPKSGGVPYLLTGENNMNILLIGAVWLYRLVTGFTSAVRIVSGSIKRV